MAKNIVDSVLGGVGGLLGGLFGGLSKKKRMNDMLNMVHGFRDQEQNWFDKDYNTDFTQLADAQRLFTHTQDYLRDRNRQAAGTAAVMGGTEESLAQAKAEDNKVLADMTSNLAANSVNAKNQMKQQHYQNIAGFNNQELAIKGDTPNGWDIASGAIGGTWSGIGRGQG